jgi:hypothetical protein
MTFTVLEVAVERGQLDIGRILLEINQDTIL